MSDAFVESVLFHHHYSHRVDKSLWFLEALCHRQQVTSVVRRWYACGDDTFVSSLLGIGGARWEAHAKATGELVTAMNPSYFSALTVTVVPGTPLAKLSAKGRFAVPPVPDLLRELRLMVEHASPTSCVFRTNHASNYLPLGGSLPVDKARILRTIDRALAGDVPLRPEAFRGL